RINNENKLEFDFGQNDEDDDSDVDLTGKTPVGPCPKCQAGVYDLGIRYACEKSIGAEKSCDFRTNKIILQQEIDADQMHKLLVDGKTDLLENFVSNRTNRKFKAFLVRDKAGKTSFEFEPRPAKKGAKKAAKKASTATKAAAKKVAAKKTAAKKSAAKKATTKTAAKKAAKKATTSTTTVEE
ncbi:MAG TPA: topoisomerase C-terminal repeat-containing protein, partial [Candidatus Paenalcaligenes intestinipullorum]|nr:topoisomerase C-terminal repeat-containing protein [Candidatus Paenalcaligenes intestinipullorum]